MAEIRLPAPVKAQSFVDLPESPNVPAGAFTYYTDDRGAIRGMIYACPCGCGNCGLLRFRPVAPADHGCASWEWNGNKETPTLSPSVHHVGHWHGWLREGRWEQA